MKDFISNVKRFSYYYGKKKIFNKIVPIGTSFFSATFVIGSTELPKDIDPADSVKEIVGSEIEKESMNKALMIAQSKTVLFIVKSIAYNNVFTCNRSYFNS